MTALVWIGVPLVVALVFGAGFLIGRHSNVERQLEDRWSDGTSLPPVNPQKLADQGGED